MSFIFKFLTLLPDALREALKEAMGIFKEIIGWGRVLWDKYVWPQAEGFFRKLFNVLNIELQKREPLIKQKAQEIIQQELEKEKQEIRNEAQEQAEKLGRSVWERLKELIKSNL